jgi:hypothetical protein
MLTYQHGIYHRVLPPSTTRQLRTQMYALFVLNLSLPSLVRTTTLVAMLLALLLLVRISNRDLRDPLFTLWVKRIIPPHLLLFLAHQQQYLILIILSPKLYKYLLHLQRLRIFVNHLFDLVIYSRFPLRIHSLSREVFFILVLRVVTSSPMPLT